MKTVTKIILIVIISFSFLGELFSQESEEINSAKLFIEVSEVSAKAKDKGYMLSSSDKDIIDKYMFENLKKVNDFKKSKVFSEEFIYKRTGKLEKKFRQEFASRLDLADMFTGIFIPFGGVKSVLLYISESEDKYNFKDTLVFVSNDLRRVRTPHRGITTPRHNQKLSLNTIYNEYYSFFAKITKKLDRKLSLRDAYQRAMAGRGIIEDIRKYIYTHKTLRYGIASKLLSFTSHFSAPKNFAISKKQVEKLEEELKPGDIIGIRHKYKLTNIGIKGLFTHAVLHIGDEDKLKSFFDSDEDVNKIYKAKCRKELFHCSTFTGYLQNKYERAYGVYLSPVKRDGKSFKRVSIESLRPGIVFTDLYSSIQKDSLFAMRYNIEKKKLAGVIEYAFKSQGTPYDYYFDLRTEDKMICSELVYNAYSEISRELGFEWVYSTKFGNPLIYIDDILKSYFRKDGSVPMEILTYLKADDGFYRSGVSRIKSERRLKADLENYGKDL